MIYGLRKRLSWRRRKPLIEYAKNKVTFWLFIFPWEHEDENLYIFFVYLENESELLFFRVKKGILCFLGR